jgi:hypothetical protein
MSRYLGIQNRSLAILILSVRYLCQPPPSDSSRVGFGLDPMKRPAISLCGTQFLRRSALDPISFAGHRAVRLPWNTELWLGVVKARSPMAWCPQRSPSATRPYKWMNQRMGVLSRSDLVWILPPNWRSRALLQLEHRAPVGRGQGESNLSAAVSPGAPGRGTDLGAGAAMAAEARASTWDHLLVGAAD